MKKTYIEEIFKKFKELSPNPRSELEYKTPYELLVAVILSAQATDRSVNIATKKLYKKAKTPKAILELGETGLIPYIQRIGLYKNKAKHIIEMSKQLLEKYDGKVPNDRESLESLSGVGRKTANVILNTVFNQPTLAVDTHIFRVANRTGMARGKTVREVEDKLLKVIPQEYLLNAHHWLLLHGRYICKARNPECNQCFMADYCESSKIYLKNDGKK